MNPKVPAIMMHIARFWMLLAALLLTATLAFAQEHATPEKTEPATKAEPAEQHQAAGHEAAAEGEHAAAKEEDQHTKLTQSSVVKRIAGILHITPKQAYWIFVLVNFVILAWGLKSLAQKGIEGLFLPIGQVFRDRAVAIKKGLEEARKASAESAARLSEIEARLSRLDADIAAMRTQAESEAKAEEERLRAATEEEKRKIVQSAEQEITSAANAARRDLKHLAAELAVSLAEKKISVSEETDKMLVRDFSANLAHPGAKGRS